MKAQRNGGYFLEDVHDIIDRPQDEYAISGHSQKAFGPWMRVVQKGCKEGPDDLFAVYFNADCGARDELSESALHAVKVDDRGGEKGLCVRSGGKGYPHCSGVD